MNINKYLTLLKDNPLYILALVLILCLIYNSVTKKNIHEDFDESKIKTQQYALERYAEYDREKYQPYLDKYFKKIDHINLRNIPVRNDGLIFCSIASYRDKQCPLTVADMIEKAKMPHRLVICINQQNDPEDADCLKDYDTKGAVIKRIKFTDREARGPCWARYLIQQEWRGEEFFLQVDSHMRFVQDWDQKCIDQVNMLPPKSCLTNYVSHFDLDSGKMDMDNGLRGPLTIDNKETSEYDGFFRVNSEFIKSADKPMLAYGWGACFSFSRSGMLHVAPYDPYTPFLFFGEEMDIWARMYTNGWYVYAPSVPICFTNFDRSYRPTFWENPDQAPCEFLSRLRVYHRFGYLQDVPEELKNDYEEYNLGKEKTYQQFLSFCLDEPKERV